MRLRLGLLRDPAVVERQIQREIKDAAAKRHAGSAPTVMTEEATRIAEELAKRERQEIREKVRSGTHTPRIRPLSESKAIEMGANFISESFLFAVAGGIILFEAWRNRRKELNRRDMVAERLETLEEQKEDLERKVAMLEEVIYQGKKPLSPAQRQARLAALDPSDIVDDEPKTILATVRDSVRNLFTKVSSPEDALPQDSLELEPSKVNASSPETPKHDTSKEVAPEFHSKQDALK